MADVAAEVKATQGTPEKEAPVEKKEKVVEKEAPQEKVAEKKVENGSGDSEPTKEKETKEDKSEAKESETQENGAAVNGDSKEESSETVLKRKSEGGGDATEAKNGTDSTDGVSPQKKPKLDESAAATQNGEAEPVA